MKKRLLQLTGILMLSFLVLVGWDLTNQGGVYEGKLESLFTSVSAQDLCNPPAPSCGPLMGNSSGTSFCCAAINTSCCYAATCGGGPVQ